jgi:hypothetical protein
MLIFSTMKAFDEGAAAAAAEKNKPEQFCN